MTKNKVKYNDETKMSYSDEYEMWYYHNLDEIRNILTNNYHGYKFAKKDMYLVDNKLFINEGGEVTCFSYPVNEYFEADCSKVNFYPDGTKKKFKDFVNEWLSDDKYVPDNFHTKLPKNNIEVVA